MRRAILIGVGLLIVAPAVLAQSEPVGTPALDGVWRIEEVVTTGANAGTIANPQPSLILFRHGYYSYMSVDGSRPRPKFAAAKHPGRLSDNEKIARFEQWDPFTANAGTYEIAGETLTRHPVVAKNDTVMSTNPPLVSEYKLEGNTLWLTTRSGPHEAPSETRTKLTRID